MTPSTMLELGTRAPDFALPDTDGKTVRMSDFDESGALLVMFLCNHCPFVLHVREGLSRLAEDYAARGVGIVGINSNDVENYPDDAPEKMRAMKARWNWGFPYLFDASQEVAKAFRAACTPDFFLFDGNRELVYRGQFDGSRPDSGIPVSGEDLRAALDAVLAGRRPDGEQRPSVGCNIKWKPGNAPDWFGGRPG